MSTSPLVEKNMSDYLEQRGSIVPKTSVYWIDPEGTQHELHGVEFGELDWSIEEDPKNFLAEPYEKLNKAVRDKGLWYATSPYAGSCWIIEEVLGIDPRTVRMEGFKFDNDTYETFMYKEDGVTKRRWDDDTVAYLTVAWTKEQRKAIREWWEFIPPELKK